MLYEAFACFRSTNWVIIDESTNANIRKLECHQFDEIDIEIDIWSYLYAPHANLSSNHLFLIQID